MIVGTLKEIKRYKGISKNIDTAIDYVVSNDLLALPLGKHEIDGTNVYCNRLSYECKELCDALAENHNHYLDLQIVLSGLEGFGYCHIDNESIVEKIAYNDVKDVTKYDMKDDIIIPLRANQYALVFPEDVHRPMVKLDDSHVEKLVVKIKID